MNINKLLILPFIFIIGTGKIFCSEKLTENFSSDVRHITGLTAKKTKSIIHYGIDSKKKLLYVIVVLNRSDSPFAFSSIESNGSRISQISWDDIDENNNNKIESITNNFLLVNGNKIDVSPLLVGNEFSIERLEEKIEMGEKNMQSLQESLQIPGKTEQNPDLKRD